MILFGILLVLIGTSIFTALLALLPAYTAFGAVVLYTGLASLLWGLYDKYVLIEVDTIEKIKKSSGVALAIMFLAYAIIISAAIITG